MARYTKLKPNRSRIKAKEFNRLTKSVEGVSRSGFTPAFEDSTGFHTRRVPEAVASGVRKAYVKTTPAAVQTVACYLSDVDGAGEEITVTCSVINGTALNAAVPRLANGEVIFVTKVGDTWWCVTTFQASQDCG